jgi:hypothetical protein
MKGDPKTKMTPMAPKLRQSGYVSPPTTAPMRPMRRNHSATLPPLEPALTKSRVGQPAQPWPKSR